MALAVAQRNVQFTVQRPQSLQLRRQTSYEQAQAKSGSTARKRWVGPKLPLMPHAAAVVVFEG